MSTSGQCVIKASISLEVIIVFSIKRIVLNYKNYTCKSYLRQHKTSKCKGVVNFQKIFLLFIFSPKQDIMICQLQSKMFIENKFIHFKSIDAAICENLLTEELTFASAKKMIKKGPLAPEIKAYLDTIRLELLHASETNPEIRKHVEQTPYQRILKKGFEEEPTELRPEHACMPRWPNQSALTVELTEVSQKLAQCFASESKHSQVSASIRNGVLLLFASVHVNTGKADFKKMWGKERATLIDDKTLIERLNEIASNFKDNFEFNPINTESTIEYKKRVITILTNLGLVDQHLEEAEIDKIYTQALLALRSARNFYKHATDELIKAQRKYDISGDLSKIEPHEESIASTLDQLIVTLTKKPKGLNEDEYIAIYEAQIIFYIFVIYFMLSTDKEYHFPINNIESKASIQNFMDMVSRMVLKHASTRSEKHVKVIEDPKGNLHSNIPAGTAKDDCITRKYDIRTITVPGTELNGNRIRIYIDSTHHKRTKEETSIAGKIFEGVNPFEMSDIGAFEMITVDITSEDLTINKNDQGNILGKKQKIRQSLLNYLTFLGKDCLNLELAPEGSDYQKLKPGTFMVKIKKDDERGSKRSFKFKDAKLYGCVKIDGKILRFEIRIVPLDMHLKDKSATAPGCHADYSLEKLIDQLLMFIRSTHPGQKAAYNVCKRLSGILKKKKTQA